MYTVLGDILLKSCDYIKETDLNNFISFLVHRGFEVEKVLGFSFYRFEGNSIKGAFSMPNSEYEIPYILGRVAINSKKDFNKMSDCPVYLPIPVKESEYQYITKVFDMLVNGELSECEITEYPRKVRTK